MFFFKKESLFRKGSNFQRLRLLVSGRVTMFTFSTAKKNNYPDLLLPDRWRSLYIPGGHVLTIPKEGLPAELCLVIILIHLANL